MALSSTDYVKPDGDSHFVSTSVGSGGQAVAVPPNREARDIRDAWEICGIWPAEAGTPNPSLPLHEIVMAFGGAEWYACNNEDKAFKPG